jgi:hypothetical protein
MQSTPTSYIRSVRNTKRQLPTQTVDPRASTQRNSTSSAMTAWQLYPQLRKYRDGATMAESYQKRSWTAIARAPLKVCTLLILPSRRRAYCGGCQLGGFQIPFHRRRFCLHGAATCNVGWRGSRPRRFRLADG